MDESANPSRTAADTGQSSAVAIICHVRSGSHVNVYMYIEIATFEINFRALYCKTPRMVTEFDSVSY